MKSFTVFYSGKIDIEANTEAEATDQAYEKLKEADVGQYGIDSTEELE